jgi:pimeloyl-ACP methyl ester carboxylesterase
MIVVVNGSNTKSSMYKPFFERLASWGFIVVGTEDAQPGKGNTTSRTLDFMLRLDRDSVLYDRIDPKAVGVVGYSQGGAGAIRAVSEHPNGTVFKAIFTGSAAYSELARNMGWAYDTRKVSVPYFMTAGTGASDDSGAKNTLKEFGGVAPLSSLSENYGRMPDAVSKVRGRVIGAEHWQIQLLTDGYMTAWMLYQLLGDVEAAAVFVGAHAEILRNSNWQDVVKSE